MTESGQLAVIRHAVSVGFTTHARARQPLGGGRNCGRPTQTLLRSTTMMNGTAARSRTAGSSVRGGVAAIAQEVGLSQMQVPGCWRAASRSCAAESRREPRGLTLDDLGALLGIAGLA
jgi:hypothetical protein